MNVLIIGGGGREHAIAEKISENKNVSKIWAAPGNGGMTSFCELIPLKATDIEGVLSFCKTHPVDYVIVAQDDPLCMGMVDALAEIGIPAFGPTKRAAEIEGSKAFAKDLMHRYGIPTAKYEVFDQFDAAVQYVRRQALPIVVKADGLALGKGVKICQSFEEAEEAIRGMMIDHQFGASGNRVVIEEFLTGPEVSVLAFTDGKTIKPMVSSMDHKRALDGDKGLNTGGMGTIAPNPYYTEEVAGRAMNEIFLPTIQAMVKEGRTFKGCLYVGLMVTEEGPKVIEYNCRFGDPETQVVLPLLKSDLLEIMLSVTNGTLADTPVVFEDKAACCVVLASGGYPVKYETGFPIHGISQAKETAHVYHAGTKLDTDGNLVTSGGRVLGVTCTAVTLKDAVAASYEAIKGISFTHCYCRSDIGKRALMMEEKA